MQHFILLALNLLERAVGLQPCSHLSDKRTGWGRVFPDVVGMFQSLIPSVLLDRACCGCVLTLSGYHSTDVTRLGVGFFIHIIMKNTSFFISSARGGKATKLLQFCADPLLCLVAPYATEGCQ